MSKLTCLMLLFSSILSQSTLTEIGTYSDGSGYNDVWGFTKNNTQYIMIGKINGYGFNLYELDSSGKATLKIDVDDTSHSGSWSELRYYHKNNKDYIYYSSERGPVYIYDITGLSSATKIHEFASAAHNLFLYNDVLILCGRLPNGNDLEAWDLSDPEKPALKWTYDKHYVHDLWISDDRMYLAELYNSSFAVFDISNVTESVLSESKLILRHTYPNGFTHNITPTADHKYVVTTDEHNQNDHLQFWDISDPANVKNLWRHQEGANSIVHNAFIKDDLIYTSYYDRGTIIFDISDKSNIVKVVEYDTYPAGQDHSLGNFKGNWGVYPFLENNLIASSDRENGLVILKLNKDDNAPQMTVTMLSQSIASMEGFAEFYVHFDTKLDGEFKVTQNSDIIESNSLDGNIYTFKYKVVSDQTTNFKISYSGHQYTYSYSTSNYIKD